MRFYFPLTAAKTYLLCCTCGFVLACSGEDSPDLSDAFKTKLRDYETTVSNETSSGYDLALSWQRQSDVDYSLYLYSNPDCDTTNIAACSDGAAHPNYGGSTLSFTGLSKSKTYYLKLEHRLDQLEYTLVQRLFWDTFGSNWAQTTDSPGWSARQDFLALSHNARMWIFSGFTGSASTNDVWSSSDGRAWTRATASAGWSARRGSAGLTFDGKMWIFGGKEGSAGSLVNDVWSSSDGASWTRATASAGWSARFNHKAVVFQNKMWIVGGGDGAYKNDVWSSSDGASWSKVKDTAAWSGRYGHALVVKDNKMWVLGGFNAKGYLNDVWSSSDGITWKEETSAAKWAARYNHTAFVFEDRLWISGGRDPSFPFVNNDVWYSQDGKSWQELVDTSIWKTRDGLQSIIFDDKFWILGGYNDSDRLDDVWFTALTLSRFRFTP